MNKNTPTFALARVMAATQQRLWKAWTVAEELQQWFGPAEVDMGENKMDLRVGGSFWYEMKAAAGSHYGLWIFEEIDEPNRLVSIINFADAHGGVIRNPWQASWPLSTRSIFTFSPVGVKETKIEIAWSPYQANEAEIKTFEAGMASMNQGWEGTFRQLEDYLKK